jgi:hypothetical protein
MGSGVCISRPSVTGYCRSLPSHIHMDVLTGSTHCMQPHTYHVHACTHAHEHTRTHACTHTGMCTHAHACTHIVPICCKATVALLRLQLSPGCMDAAAEDCQVCWPDLSHGTLLQDPLLISASHGALPHDPLLFSLSHTTLPRDPLLTAICYSCLR